MGRARRLRVLTVALATSLLIADPAAAAPVDVTMDGSVLRITGTDAADHSATVTRSGGTVVVTANAAPAPVTADGPQCTVDPAPALAVRCSGANGMSLISIRLGAGEDFVVLSGDPGAEADVDLGDGGDFYAGGNRRSVVRGGGGRDFLDDEGPSSSVLDGGPGSDLILPGLGSDEVVGGPGIDEASYTSRDADLQLSLDGLPNDGDPALGERDNLLDMEVVRGGDGDDDIRGDGDFNELEGNDGNDRLEGGGGFDRLTGGDGGDLLLARDGLAERVECGMGADSAVTDDIDAVPGCEAVDRSPELQPDRDGDGVTRPADCDDLDAAFRPGAFDRPGDGRDQDCNGADAVELDRDRDGFPAPLDCDDANRAIRPGAGERLGNFVDEDCDRRAEPFPRITATMILSTRKRGARTATLGLVVADLEGGERIAVTCRGPGCSFTRKRARARRRATRIQLDRFVRDMRLGAGARLRVTVTRADGVKRVLTAKIRAGAPPRRMERCVAPPGAKVAGC